MKMQDEKCPMCKEITLKIYISSDKESTLAMAPNAICDPEYDIWFEDVKCKNYI